MRRFLAVFFTVVALAGSLGPALAFAQPAETPVTPVGDDSDDTVLAITPDGRFAVLHERFPGGAAAVWRYDLWLGERELLTDDEPYFIDAEISDDGSVVVIDHQLQFIRSIKRFDLNNGEVLELARGSRVAGIAVSPDGHSTYFSSNSPHLTPGNSLRRFNLYRYDHATGTTDRLTQRRSVATKLVVSANELVVTTQRGDADGEVLVLLDPTTDTDVELASTSDGYFDNIRFTPDGNRLVFRQTTSAPPGGETARAIHIYDVRTGQVLTPMQVEGEPRLFIERRPSNRSAVVEEQPSGAFTRIDLATGATQPVVGAANRTGFVSQSFRYQAAPVFDREGAACGVRGCVEVDLHDIVYRDYRPEQPRPPLAPDSATAQSDGAGALISWAAPDALADGYVAYIDGHRACGAREPARECRTATGPLDPSSTVKVVPFNAGGEGTPRFADVVQPNRAYVTGYTAEEWARAGVAAQHFGIPIDDLQRFGVLALRYIHALGGSQGTEPLDPPPDVTGPVQQTTDWSDDADYEALQWVMNYYDIGPEEAQKLGVSVLVFFASLDGAAF